MIIGTANIKNYPDMGEKDVVADGREMSHLTDLWGMQENSPDEDLPAIMAALGDDWNATQKGTDTPILFRKSVVDLMDSRQVVIPFDPMLPLTSRPRRITLGVFKLVTRPGVAPFVVINLHPIAGGYNGPELPARKRQWDIEWQVTKDTVREYREQGFTVFVLGDFNHPRPPFPIPNWQWLVGERLDRIGVSTRGGVTVNELESGVVQLHSDHSGQWVNVWLAKDS